MKTKEIPHPKPQFQRIVADPFILARIASEAGAFWIQHEDGEGMQTSEEKIVKMLEEFWAREF